MPFLSTNEMNTFTNRNVRRTAIDQVYKSAAMLAIMKAKNRLKIEDGGSIIAQPLLVQINQTTQTYSGADVLNVAVQEEFTNYELGWKQINTAVTITGIDQARNTGRHQQLDLLKNKQESALLSHMNSLAGQVFADGTGNNGKDWDGFNAAINNAAGFQYYLGIDRAANPWWQAQIFDPGTPTALSTGNMMTLFMTSRVDEEEVDVISATNAGYQVYWSLLTPGERYVDDFVGNLGFSNIAFQGKPLVADSHNPAGLMYGFNLDHCRMVVHKDKNMRFMGFDEPTNQDVIIGHWRTYGNFENRKPASCFAYRNIQNG